MRKAVICSVSTALLAVLILAVTQITEFQNLMVWQSDYEEQSAPQRNTGNMQSIRASGEEPEGRGREESASREGEPKAGLTWEREGSREQKTSLYEEPPEPPLELMGYSGPSSYARTNTLEIWRHHSGDSCADSALKVLTALKAEGVELKEAGYLDLSGESWGCVFIIEDNASFVITMIPERPFSVRSDTNRLVVSIIRYLEPEI